VPPRSRDVRVRVLSEHNDKGFKSAEASAKVLERELGRLEQAERRQVAMHTAAAREMAAAEAAKAAAIVDANRRQGEAMTSAGKAILGASTAAAVGLGLTAKAAMDWESAWAGVTKTVTGEEIAGVAEAAGQLGVKRQDVAAFTKTMIDLGETTNLSADEASTSIAQFSNIMGIGADQASRLGASLVALGNDGASTEADIMSMGLRIAGAGRTAGLTAPQVLAVASALASVGIEAEAGGSAISRVMTQIESDVTSGSDVVAEYARVAGMSAEDFATAWQRDAAGALTSFVQGLGAMQASGEDTTAVLDELGFADLRVADTLRRASLAGDLLSDSLSTGSEAFEENIALVEEANKRYQTTEARLQMARNQINDAAIDIGANLLPAFAAAADKAGALATGFGALPPQAQGFVTALGASAVGLGGVVGGAAIVIPKLKELGDTVNDLRGGQSNLGKALGGTASFLAGPWGLALAAAAIGVGAWMTAQGEAKRRIDEMTAALDEQTGAITDNYRQKVIAQLADSKALEAARTLGIELDKVTDAALGNGEAQAVVGDAIARVAQRSAAAAADTSLYNKELVAQEDAANLLTRQLGVQGTQLEDSRNQWQMQREAMGESAAAALTTKDSQAELTFALEQGGISAEDAAEALDGLQQALDDLNSPMLDVRESQRAWQESIDAVTKSIEENGTTLDINTEAGRSNEQALDAMAQAAARRAQAILEQTGSEEQFRGALDQSRQSLYEQAIRFGMTEDAAWAYVDQVLKVPPKVVTTAEFEASAAEARIASFKRNLAMPAVVITPEVRASSPFYANRADGGVFVEHFADGGTRENHVAQIARAGEWRVWAEDETGGEAYIPLSPAKRVRSEAILEDVASRFGMYVGKYADGAVLGGGQAASGTLTGVRLTGTLDLGNGLTGLMDARIADAQTSVGQDAAGRRRTGGWS
jgi:TP901 family phage tail tape measure protein